MYTAVGRCIDIGTRFQDYLTLVSQLEHAFVSSSTFTLQKLWFYVHPTLHTLSILYTLTTELHDIENPPKEDEDSSSEEDPEAEEHKRALGLGNIKAVIKDLLAPSAGLVKGGEVMAILWERMRNYSGYVCSKSPTPVNVNLTARMFASDPTASEVYRNLLHRASLPYCQMLKRWTTTGHLKDPYEEIMVKETKSINRGMLEMDFIDEYWEKRYTVGFTSTSKDRASSRGFLLSLPSYGMALVSPNQSKALKPAFP